MNNLPKISVIVPIYKVEDYIRRCLRSIQKQTFTDFEVILIDDGTPDRSAEIAAEFAGEDSRFRLFHQKNKGVGAVRNRALIIARGEYVAFIDSDDTVFEDHLEKLYSAAAGTDADIVCAGYCCMNENEKLRRSKIRKSAGVYDSKTMSCNAIRDISVRRYLWNKLWRRSLFVDNGIFFPCMQFEDCSIIPILFHHAKIVAAITDPTYIYTIRNNSITGLTGKNCVGDYLAANERVENYFSALPDADSYRLNLAYQRVKTFAVSFCWVFVRAYRARTLDYFGGNMKKIFHYLAEPSVFAKKKREKRKKRRLSLS